MTEPVVYLNDRFVPASQASLNIYDLGIVLGATVTEMTRTFGHQPFRLEDHLARLYRSCKYVGIPLALDQAELFEISMELIRMNSGLIGPGDDLGVVHFVTPGEQPLYAGSAAGSARRTPTVCVHSFPLPFFAWRHLLTDGAHVVTPAVRHVPPECVDPKAKNRSRLHWFIADQQSQAVDPQATSLLLDLQGNITECSGANFLICAGRTVYAPTSRNILEGVSMVTVRELAKDLGLAWVEKDLQPYDVINADEAWLTSTPYGLAPCTKINGVAIGDGKPGPIYHELSAAWSRLVGLDIEAQVLGTVEAA
ncbi:MAG: aminotransferase class IV [Trueperaceae bacterium]|nr:MAG: aminotransferase class IV [Trueperaceae bacterium]